MTGQEYNLIHEFLQATVDTACARGMCWKNGKEYLMINPDEIQKLSNRIYLLIDDNKEE